MTTAVFAEIPAGKKSNHRANIVRITETLPHSNADTLEIVKIGSYQVVVKKDSFKVGSLGVYVQPDSVVPQTEPFRFLWEGHAGIDGKVPEKRRRITVRKFRGEWSEGLLLPVHDFDELVDSALTRHFVESDFHVGSDVSDLLGITHYDPDAGKESTGGLSGISPKRRLPRSLKGWVKHFFRRLFGKTRGSYAEEVSFHVPVYDVESYKNHTDIFDPQEIVIVTEKIHGSNGRFLFLDGVMYAGSRTQWKSEDSPCVWRKALRQHAWIERWCRNHPGYTLFGEVTPRQKNFDYGTIPGEVQFFVFDVLDPNGDWIPGESLNYFSDLLWNLELNLVPTLYIGPFRKCNLEAIVSGPSRVSGARHIREGIVIKPAQERRVPGLGRVQLKLVSNEFLVKDSR